MVCAYAHWQSTLSKLDYVHYLEAHILDTSATLEDLLHTG